MSQDASLDLGHYMRMLWRRRGVVVLAAVTVLCTAVIGLPLLPEEYESSVTLRVEERRHLAGDLEKVIGGGGGSGGGYRVDQARLDEMAARITSRPFLERVARLLKMNEDPRVIEGAIEDLEIYPGASVDELAIRRVVRRLKSRIKFANAGMGNYQIIYSDSDPYYAKTIVKWIGELFVDYSLQSSLEELRTAHDFGAEQEKIYKERLRLSELALQQYKQAAIETDLSRGFVRAQNVTRAETLHKQILDEVDLSRLRLLPLSRSIAELDLESAARMTLADAQVQNQVRALRTNLRENVVSMVSVSEARGATEWPPGEGFLILRRGLYRLIERRTAEIHGGRGAEERDLIGRYAFASIDHEEQTDVAGFLGRAITDFKVQAQATPRDEMELRRLEAEVETNRSLLGSFRAQLIAGDIKVAMEVTNLGMRVEILDPPQIPLEPARPDKMKILLAAIVLGPLLGVGIAFVTEILDPTLRSLADFQRVFGGPILGMAPMLTAGREVRHTGFRRHWTTATIVGLILLTTLFFLTRGRLLPDPQSVHNSSTQVIDPGSELRP